MAQSLLTERHEMIEDRDAVGSKDQGGMAKSPTARTPLTVEQQNLATRYIPMARKLAMPMKSTWPAERGEFESAAMLALVEAAQSFEPGRNVKFGTYARYRIWGALRGAQRRIMAAQGRLGHDDDTKISSLFPDIEEVGSVVNGTPDRPVGEEDEAIEFVESYLRKLPVKHATACREIYIHGKSQSEAAQTLGCSKSRLSYLHSESLAMIKDQWAYEARLEDLEKPRKRGF